jgi:hypothetical protein
MSSARKNGENGSPRLQRTWIRRKVRCDKQREGQVSTGKHVWREKEKEKEEEEEKAKDVRMEARGDRKGRKQFPRLWHR